MMIFNIIRRLFILDEIIGQTTERLLETPTKMISNIIRHVLTNFENITGDLHEQAIKRTNILTAGRYSLVVLMLPLIIIIYDSFYPLMESLNIYLIFVIVMPVLLGIAALLYLWLRKTKYGKVALNWQLEIASRYLEICEASKVYNDALLPQLQLNDLGARWYCMLAGSSKDGFGFFPFLSSNNGILPWSRPVLTQDVDVNIFLHDFILNESSLVYHSLGYYFIEINPRSIPEKHVLRKCIVFHNSNYMLSGKLVTYAIAKSVLGQVEFNYPAVTCKTTLNGPYGKSAFDIDIVFGAKLSSWPSIASGWSKRVENILTKDILTEILRKGCYLVHKHCSREHNDHGLDWRMSFAESESILFQYHREKQALKLVYVVLKFAIKCHGNKRQRRFSALKSYHLKTLFLWIAEKEKSLYFDLCKVAGNKQLGELLRYFVSEYRQCLYTGELKHYFVSGINLLEIYTQDERTEAMQLMDEFLAAPLNILANFEGANLTRWKYDQFIIISLLVIFASMGFHFYYNNMHLFEPVSIVMQIYRITGVFTCILMIKIILD